MSDNNNSVSHQTIELLTRCLQLQSEKDGIQRPTPDKALTRSPGQRRATGGQTLPVPQT
ncbi:hypothetical protein ACQKFC_27955 [Raoultella planticola]|uniref:hypothetical protein n=1 Tax=Raoultella planticola TaxID=575 RepID=UPI003D0291BD